MEVVLRSKVKLLPLPRSKMAWIKILPLSRFDNPPSLSRSTDTESKTVVAKTLILTSENELRYFQLELHRENEKTKERNQIKSELKVGDEWTHSFGESLQILLFHQQSPFEDQLIITKESGGLGFYTKSSSSSGSAATLDNKGIDIRFSKAFETTPGKFKDHFAMGKIWCGESFVSDGMAIDCSLEESRLGAVFHDPKGNLTSFYFLQKYSILNAPSAEEGDDILFPLDDIPLELPAEVEGALDKIWIIPMPSSVSSSSSSSQDQSKNDVIVFQKDGRLFLFQLNESSQLVKLGDLKLPVGLPGKENADEMVVQSLNLFESDAFNLAVTFKSMTVIFALDQETQLFRRSSFFYFDKGQTPLFFEGQEEPRKTQRNEKDNLLFLLDGPSGLRYSSHSLDFRPISTPNPNPAGILTNLPHLKVVATTPLNNLHPTPNPTRILFYDYQNAIFAAPFTTPKIPDDESRFLGLNSENEGIDWDIGQELDHVEGDDCFDDDCLFDLMSPGLTSPSEKDSSTEKLESRGNARINLWDKSILDLIQVKQLAESAALPAGQIQFNLQFIPLTGFSVSYTSNSDSSESSGSLLSHKDWHISAHPFVARVRKSVFEKLDKFYLILESQPHPLTLATTTQDSTGNPLMEFTAPTAPQYKKILYHSSTTGKNYWEFESKGATAFFGQQPNSPTDSNALRFQYEARMKNWSGGSLDSKFPVEWHLTQFVNHATSQTFDYKYRSINPQSQNSNHKWNHIEPQALFISNVTSIPYKNLPAASDSKKLELQFEYGEIGVGKSQLLLFGYTLKTESYQQIVDFRYDTDPNATPKMLTGIRQQFGGSWREMLKFSYSKHSGVDVPFRPFETAKDSTTTNSGSDQNQNLNQKMTSLLSSVEFPTLKTKVQFTFTQPKVAQLPRRPENSIVVKNVESAAATHGFGFSVVTADNFLHFYKHTDGSVQTVKFAEVHEIQGIDKLNVVLNSACAFLYVRERSQVKIQAYCFTTNPVGNELNWQRAAEKIFPQTSSNPTRIILSHEGTIFTVEEDEPMNKNKIWIHEWTESPESPDSSQSPSLNRPPSHSWKSSSMSTTRPPRALQLQGNFLSWMEIMADKRSAEIKYLPYREKGGWDWANIHERVNLNEGREDCFTFFSRLFQLRGKDQDNVYEFFHPARPPVDTNVIAVPSCRLKPDGQTIETVVDLLVLDENERVKSRQTFAIQQDNTQTGVNLSNYSVLVAPQNTIWIGGKSKIYWDVQSSQWKLLAVQENLNVGGQNLDRIDLKLNENGLKLEKSGRDDTFKIRVGGLVVKDLGVKNSTGLINFFPDFMAAISGNGFNLLEFPSTDKSVVKETGIEGENILQGLTSTQILATSIQQTSSSSSNSVSGSSPTTQIRLRTMAFNPQLILTQVTIEGGKYLKRKTGYDYSITRILANGRLIFGTRKVIPGAKSHKTGWMEYTDSYQGNPKIYDNRGNFIGRMQQRDNSGNEETSPDNRYSLLDVTETQKILDTHPYVSSECQVGYYGFQEYEKKRAGEDCPDWEFPETNVISNDFPLAGRRFLRLTHSNQTLSTSFLVDPEIGEDYTISAWVRSPLIKLEDTISPILKAKIQGMDRLTWLSKILLEEDGWFLLQINILSHELDAYKKSLVLTDNSNSNNIIHAPDENLQVTITISGQSRSKVDVDHVLYAPSGWNSEITIFDPSTLRVTDRILGRNGLLSHNKFDAFEKPLAQINSEGSVMHHEIRSPSIQGSTNTQGLVASAKFEVLGAAGWYESCDPSLKQSLTLQNPNAWRLSPGFAHHVGWSNSDESGLLFKIRDQESFLFRFTYDIDVPSFANLTQPGVLLYYKNLKILSIEKNPGSRENNTVKLRFDPSLFSTDDSTFEIEIPPKSSISFGMLMNDRVLVWIGEELKLDSKFSSATSLRIIQRDWKNVMAIEARGSVSFGDILILPNPKLTMSYCNILGEKIQEIEVVSKSQIRVSQILYDELGRNMVVTKPTVINLHQKDPLLSFRSEFVTRFRQEGTQMQMDGEISLLNPEDGGIPFTMIKYGNNSFVETVGEEGRPGVDFSIGGRFQKIYSSENPHVFVQLLYPESDGFQYRVSKTHNSQSFYEEVTVYIKDLDGSERTHASVVISQTGKNLLATYDYDDRGNLIASHSPEFHTHFKSILKGGSWENLRKTINSNDPGVLATFYKYDNNGRLVQKSSPDMGIVNMIYDGTSDKVKYTIHRKRETPGHIDTIMYYEYENEGGSLSEVGILKGYDPAKSPDLVFNSGSSSSFLKVPRRVIKTQENSELASIFFKTDLIVSSFGQNDDHGNSTVFDDYIELVDTKVTTMNVVTRTALFPTKPGIPALLVPTSFQYNAQADKLLRINMPYQDNGILYRYDKLGQLSSISISAPNSVSAGGLFPGVFDIANYEYNGSGAVVRERLHGFNKKDALDTTFSYNSPGFPTERKNEFIKESLTYEDDGYGDRSTGTPSSVMSSTSTRFWENPEGTFYSDASDFIHSGVSSKIAVFCYAKLVEFGYIKEEKVAKMLHPKMDTRLPLVCTSGTSGAQIQKVFTQKVLKTRSLPFSFKYQYGPHRDLVKVKFVLEENENKNQPFCSKPLTSENFLEQIQLELEAPERDEAAMNQIWEKLVQSGFLVRAAENGLFSQIHWKPGKSFFNPSLLQTVLKDKVLDAKVVNLVMHHLASMVGVQIQDDSDNHPKKLLKTWTPAVPKVEQKAETLIRNLNNDGFLSSSPGQVLQVTQNVFHPEFLAAFDSGQNAKMKGVMYKTLLSYFNCAVGSSPLDKEVMETDMNGNFKLFYNGLQRVELDYSKGTNRIKSIKIASSTQRPKEYEITHDHFGNLNSAPHHQIERIVYDEITAKPILMQMANGSTLKFRYDLRGERVTKEVFGPSGVLLKKTKYLSRDEHGRSLLEEEFYFVSPDIPHKTRTTLYIYNPDRSKGLVGFIRNGKLYNVFTDNINSVRLVMLDGHVVGAWDYFPYGTTMNEYIQHGDASIPYRFSGQEQDEETGLYNFHARIYDPFLGRFYQIDPEEQFFSPYKYAGNSPLNAIDPDGKFIFTLILAVTLAGAGAYIGGSSANNNWNPVKWNWKKPGTYLGIAGGALSGAFIIPSGGASLAVLTPALGASGAFVAVASLGAVGAYSLAASANKNWDPSRWDFQSPGTYNALFSGIAMGVALPTGISSYGALVHTLTKPGQLIFIGASVSSGVGAGYLSAASVNQNYAFWEWDYSNPATIVTFGASGTFVTLGGAAVFKTGRYLLKQHQIAFPGFQNVAKKIVDSFKEKGSRGASPSPVFSKEAAIAVGKIIGTVTPVGVGGYIAVAAASDSWILVDWTNAGTYAALVNGMWAGWIAGSGIRQGGQYLRKQVTSGRAQTNVQNRKSWQSQPFSTLKSKFNILTSRITNLPRFRSEPRPRPGPSSSSSTNAISPVKPNLNVPRRSSLKSLPSPTSKLASMGNSKWTVFGFSGQGKGGVVYVNLYPTPASASSWGNSSSVQSDARTDSNIQKRITKEKEKVEEILSFVNQQNNPEEKQKFLEKLKSLFCDPSFAGSKNECEYNSERMAMIATALEELTSAKLRDGTLGSDWDHKVQTGIEWAEKKFMIKSLLEKVEKENGISELGDNLISANFHLNQLQLRNPGDSKYSTISNYIKHDISKAVQKSIVQKQGFYQDKAPKVAGHIKNQILDTNYKFSLSNWASSNCGKSVVLPAASKAKKVLGRRLDKDKDNSNGIGEGGVDYVSIYNPRTMKKRNRCSQCLVTRENLDVEQLKFFITEESWLTKIDGVDNAVFFQGNKTEGIQREGKDINLGPTDAPVQVDVDVEVEEEQYDYGYDYADESIVSNSRANPPMYFDMSNSSFTPSLQHLRQSLPHAFSSASFHGGIIQSVHKTIKSFVTRAIPKFPTLQFDLNLNMNFWTTEEELKSESFVDEKLFGNQHIPIRGKSEESGKDGDGENAFSTRCLPFYTIGHDDAFGLSCSFAHGQIIVFYPDPQQQQNGLLPLISGTSSSSSSGNQLHSFDKDSCQFLASFHGQNAAFCQGSTSNILYVPNRPTPPLDSLNDQLLLLLLAQHFLQNWFGFNTKTPDDDQDDDDSCCPESESTAKSEKEEQLLTPDELTNFASQFKVELKRLREARERLILQLKTQQQREEQKHGFQIKGNFLHFCNFYIDDLEEEFSLELETDKLNGFSSHRRSEYMERLMEIEAEMEEDFQALTQFGQRSSSSAKKYKNGHSIWNFVQGMFYSSHHHKSQ